MLVPSSVPSVVFTWLAIIRSGCSFHLGWSFCWNPTFSFLKKLAPCITKAICLQAPSTLRLGLPEPVSSPIVLHLAHLAPAH